MSESWSNAVHEAGHAVIATRLGFVCNSVSIVPEGDSVGHATVIYSLSRGGNVVWPRMSRRRQLVRRSRRY
jgi:hypothetical protein